MIFGILTFSFGDFMEKTFVLETTEASLSKKQTEEEIVVKDPTDEEGDKIIAEAIASKKVKAKPNASNTKQDTK